MNIEIGQNQLKLIIGDITKQKADVIVNAANGTLLGGGGVDGAIHLAAGPQLLEECKHVRQMELNGEHLKTGEAVITKGYNLAAKYVIHTVGPIWENETEEEILLKNCYKNTLELAHKHNLNHIVFPSISTGVYRYPIHLAAKVALETIIRFLLQTKDKTVVITLFSKSDYLTYKKTLKQISV